MTILESLLGVVIAATALTILTPAFTTQLASSRNDGTLPAVEAVVSRDLAWISTYARWWKATSGPFNISSAITYTTSFLQSEDLAYAPPAARCSAGTLAAGFLADAAAVANVNPARPYTIPSAGSSTDLTTINGITVKRAISTSGSTLALTYSLSGSGADALGFNRQVGLLVDASAWCETLP